jgi:hypothetical protein
MLNIRHIWIAIIAVALAANNAAAQCCTTGDDTTGRIHSNGLYFGYTYDHETAYGFVMEGNFLMGSERTDLFHGPYVGANFFQGAGGNVYRTSLGYQCQFTPGVSGEGFTTRMGLALDSQNGENGLYLTPEIGGYFVYAFEARVGYRIPLNNTNYDPPSPFYFSIGVNLNLVRVEHWFDHTGSRLRRQCNPWKGCRGKRMPCS